MLLPLQAGLLAALLLAASPANAQPTAPPSDSTHIYTEAQRMPYLPGDEGLPRGYFKIIPFIHKALGMPADVRAGKVEGQVLVEFVVGPSGVVKDAKIKQGLSPAVDAAVLKAMTRLPRFVPGRQNGQSVSVSCTVPVGLWGPKHIYAEPEVGLRAQFPTMGYAGYGVAYNKYVREKLRPIAAVQAQRLSGRIEASFVVDAAGQVRDAQITKGLCPTCDAEIVRLLLAMPAWTPARNQQGQAVPSRQLFQISLPVPPPETVYPDKVYQYVDQMPELPNGGSSAAIAAAIRERVVGGSACSGRLFLSFTVKADGTVSDAKIIKGLNSSCDTAALAAVAKLPRFKPGRQGGQAVSVSYTVPVTFASPAGK